MIEHAAVTLTVGAIAGGVAFGGPLLLSSVARRRLRRTCVRRGAVCLTYDDGPGPTLTPRVLDLLADESVRATFYLFGNRVGAAPEMPERVASAGHEVGAHSMWHTHAWKTMPWQSYKDVEEGYRTLARWVRPDGRFRPPYGKLNLGSWLAVRRRGSPIDWWTVDSGDTWPSLPDSEEIAARVVGEGGGVVLLHDFDRDGDRDARSTFVLETTRAVIRAAREVGLRLGTMSELASDGATA